MRLVRRLSAFSAPYSSNPLGIPLLTWPRRVLHPNDRPSAPREKLGVVQRAYHSVSLHSSGTAFTSACDRSC